MERQTAAIEALLALIEEDVGIKGTCADDPDADPVGWDGDGNPLPMMFGHVRRARAELEVLKVMYGI